jgi:hypothetical protein
VQSVLAAARYDTVASTHTRTVALTCTLVQNYNNLNIQSGFDDPDPVGHQCGEHTFESTFNIPPRADGAPLDIMWKYFIAVSDDDTLNLIISIVPAMHAQCTLQFACAQRPVCC